MKFSLFLIIYFNTFNYPSLKFKISPFWATKNKDPSISAGDDKLLEYSQILSDGKLTLDISL